MPVEDGDDADAGVHPSPGVVVHVHDQAVRRDGVEAVVEERDQPLDELERAEHISMTPAKTTQPAQAVGPVSYRALSADARCEVSVICAFLLHRSRRPGTPGSRDERTRSWCGVLCSLVPARRRSIVRAE